MRVEAGQVDDSRAHLEDGLRKSLQSRRFEVQKILILGACVLLDQSSFVGEVPIQGKPTWGAFNEEYAAQILDQGGLLPTQPAHGNEWRRPEGPRAS